MSTQNEYTFKAETNKVLQIITHSLYQNNEVFLRELISNASDALNKVRIKKLTSENILDADAELMIEIIPDKEHSTLTVRDTGIGMTKAELIENLGTIAQSGTEQFLQAIEEGGDSNELIGMFGVGFYSAFLVSDKVEVHTRGSSPNSNAWKWVSSGEDSFAIESSEKTTRGTEIVLHLKEDADEYLDSWKLKSLVKQYSNYIQFPIYVISKDEEGQDKREQANELKALWRANPSEVEEEQYQEFYHSLGQFGDPLATIHINVEVPIQFFAILYIPPNRPQNWGMADSEWGLTLYNRKVLINENNKDLLPEYMRFVKGVVDGEDLKLNVSREVLQTTRAQLTIKKYIQKKILEELEKMAEEDEDKYMDFFRQFGVFIKEGIAANDKNKDRLVELLRFNSTAEEGKDGSVSLSDYITRMKPDQDKIYYLTGLELDLLKKSPHLEYYKENDYEVLLLGEAIDSFLMMHLNEYHEKQFFLIDQDEDTDEDEEEISEEDEEEEGDTKKEKTGPFAPLLNRMVDVLGTKVQDVKTSDRLVGSFARLVTPKGGINSNLQRAMRIMETQSGGAGMNLPMMGKILQLNPNHELIKNLNKLVEENAEDERIDTMIYMIHDSARIIDGDIPDFTQMLTNLEDMMKQTLR